MVARLFSYRLPTSLPDYPIREGLILQWNDGFGEIAPLPRFSKETLEEARAEILSLLPDLTHAQPRHPSVQWAVSSASTPFSQEQIRIPLCSLNSPKTPILKLKLGRLPIPDAIAHTKQFIGKYTLRLDCNRSWTLDQACDFASHFSQQDFDYLEEPVRTFSEIIRFSELTAFPIALDESFHFPLVQMPPTLKAIVWKPMIRGVPLPFSPVPLVLSSSYESSLGLLQIGRLYQPHMPPSGLDTFHLFKDDLLVSPLVIGDGCLSWSPVGSCPINLNKLRLIAEVL